MDISSFSSLHRVLECVQIFQTLPSATSAVPIDKKSERTIQFIGHWFVACPAALGTSEKRLAACGAMIAFALCASPCFAALLITKLGYFTSP